MKKLMLLLISLGLTILIFAQNDSPYIEGEYLSVKEFINRSPKYVDSLILIKRTTSNIKLRGGSDYKVENFHGELSNNDIKKRIWGIYNNGTLYLNGIFITGSIGYTKVEVLGKYCFIKPAFPKNRIQQKDLGLECPINYSSIYIYGAVGGVLGGLSGGVIGGAIGGTIGGGIGALVHGANMSLERVPLIYTLRTGKIMLLDKQSILYLLENHLELKSEFNREFDFNNEKLLLEYLIKLNEIEQ